MDIKNADFADLVGQYRQQRGMSQGQLAQATRLSRTYVYHLETGMRKNPSEHVIHSIVRALGLQGSERRHLYDACTRLTGHSIAYEEPESTLLDLGELADLLVRNTSYPAHSLDRLWFLHSWNEAAIMLFEVQQEVASGRKVHLLELVFDARLRRHFHGWRNLVRRLVGDFHSKTPSITHLPQYITLCNTLHTSPH